MASSYPGGLDAFTNPSASDTLDSATVPHADQHSNANDAIEAIESTLGVNPQGGSATVSARLTALDSTVAGKAPASGISPSAITGTAVVDSDPRLTDSRTPTAHAATHGVGGTDPVTVAPSQVTGTAVITTDARLSDTRVPTDGSVTDAKIATTLSPSKITGTAVVDSDPRLSDARTPTAHASTHGVAGSDPVTVASSQVTGLATSATTDTTNADNITSGTLPNARLVAVPNSALANSSVTVNGSAIALGGSATVTAAPSGSAGGDLTGTYPNPTLVATGTAGTYTKVTTDSKGRVTSGTTLTDGDIPTLEPSKITGTAYTVAQKKIDEYRLANSLDIMPRMFANQQTLLNNGFIYATLFTPAETFTVTNLSMYSVAGGTDVGGTTVRRMGLFACSGTDNKVLTLIARTASDSTLFNANNTIYTRALNTTGGYPSTYTLNAGTTYAFGVIVYNTGGTFGSPRPTFGNILSQAYTPHIVLGLSAQTDLPTAATTFITNTGNLPFARLT